MQWIEEHNDWNVHAKVPLILAVLCKQYTMVSVEMNHFITNSSQAMFHVKT